MEPDAQSSRENSSLFGKYVVENSESWDQLGLFIHSISAHWWRCPSSIRSLNTKKKVALDKKLRMHVNTAKPG
jgi:hypothetical protein